MSQFSLVIDNVSKKYKDFTLDNVSFELPKGSIMGFIGENGAGKSTTIKAILNLIKMDSGTISVFGLDNIKDEKKIKEDIGVVLDESNFPDNLNPKNTSLIFKNIYKNWDDEIYYSYIKRFNLPNDKIIKEYSRGMKMKLAIAVALAHKPKLLILDEATSGLDPVVRNEILDVFLDFIQDEEHSILMSSHITSDLEKIADYITFIHQGKILFSKSKDTLLYEYGILKCKIEDFNLINKSDIMAYKKTEFSYEILVNDKEDAKRKYSNYVIDNVTLEDIMLLLVKGERI